MSSIAEVITIPSFICILRCVQTDFETFRSVGSYGGTQRGSCLSRRQELFIF